MKKWLFGTILLVSFSVLFSSQEVFADVLFEDNFDVDPASNGWTESIIAAQGVSADIISIPGAAKFDITSFTNDKTTFSISREIPTSGFENVKLELIARQSLGVAFEPLDFLAIDIDSGSGFETILKDVEVWNGENDLVGEPGGGNQVFTSTGLLDIQASTNVPPSIIVKITAEFESHLEDYELDKITITGDPIEEIQIVGGEIIPIESTLLLLSGIHYTGAWLIPILVSLVGIGFVLVKRKH